MRAAASAKPPPAASPSRGASVAVIARRQDRLDTLVADIKAAGGTALAVVADITDRTQAEQAVVEVIDRFGRLDILVNNAGLMLLGPIVGADVEEWERMIAVNQNGLLYMTNAALPHLLAAAKDGPREVADIVNISSIAGRQAWANYGAYNMTKFGVNGFTEALRQEVTKKHVRVAVLEPGVHVQVEAWCLRALGHGTLTSLRSDAGGQMSNLFRFDSDEWGTVAVKVRPDSKERISRCLQLQAISADAGFPCARPVTDADRLGPGMVISAESWRPGGRMHTEADAAFAGRSASLLADLAGILDAQPPTGLGVLGSFGRIP
ncbi:MAG: SDR family NAD(P)-dependent oxidoreductase [Arthrobacter sp.]